MFKKFLIFILSFVLFTFSGCLVVPQDSSSNDTNIDDLFVGLMFTLYERGEDNFVPVTSDNYGDENCIAAYIEYNNKNGEKWFTSAESGSSYLSPDSNTKNGAEVNDGNSTRISYEGSVIYCNSAYFTDDVVFSMDSLFRDDNGKIVREQGTIISNSVGGVLDYTTANEIKKTVTHTETVNGKNEEKVETYKLSVSLTVKMREAGIEWRIVQYDKNGQMLDCTSVDKEDEGDFEVKEECAFVIAEEVFASGEVKRTLYEKEKGKWGKVEFFYDGGFGILAKLKFNLIDASGKA